MGWILKDDLTIINKFLNEKNDNKVQCSDHLGNVYPSITDMCKRYKISMEHYYIKLLSGYTLEEALTPNVKKGKKIIDPFGNVFLSVIAMCEHYKIPYTTYKRRMTHYGWTFEEALTIPKNLSLGEYRVSECLKRLNVKFYHDCTIKTVFTELKVSADWNDFLTELQSKLGLAGYKWSKKKIQKLRPDFVLYTDNDNKIRGVIEFDGEQHQNFVEYFFKTIEEFFRRSHVDFVKQSLWEYLKIPMLRIRYDQEDKIDEMVTHFIANPEQYLTRHNTYLSEEEYWEPLESTRNQLEYAY